MKVTSSNADLDTAQDALISVNRRLIGSGGVLVLLWMV